MYHRNDSTSLCTIHFIYILVLEDVIGADVGDGFYWPTLYICANNYFTVKRFDKDMAKIKSWFFCPTVYIRIR